MNIKFLAQNLKVQDWTVGYQLLDDYVILRVLGEGGMGKVYLVQSRSTGSEFAVKRAKCTSEGSRKNFLAELQTWIDLPEHPNLASCRFFRTLDEEVLIFAEYIKGGSLKDWIDTKRLYEGGHSVALERMLHVAIQLAWALQCVHKLGIVHQDVKPGNVLMGKSPMTSAQEIKPQVTDFGLVRARATTGEIRQTDVTQNILVSNSGGTPAYWSPEQSQGLPLTNKTDIWSWGVSALELFTGEVSWLAGQGAAAVLDLYLQENGCEDSIPAMPTGMANLLRKCFSYDPVNRPASLSEAVADLKAIYLDSIGIEYSYILSSIAETDLLQTGINERQLGAGAAWTASHVWLEKASIAAGHNPSEVAAKVARRAVTRRGELVAELMVYEEAKLLYDRLVNEGRKEFQHDLASLCMDKAEVHSASADSHGALREYDHALTIWQQLANQDGHCDLTNILATAYRSKAATVNIMGDLQGARLLCNQAIFIFEKLVNQEGRREFIEELQLSYRTKATILMSLDDIRGAMSLFDQALNILEKLVYQEGRHEFSHHLTLTLLEKATALCSLGDLHGAITLCDQSIAILDWLVNQNNNSHLANSLAGAYSNKAVLVSSLGDESGALTLHDEAITITERLVYKEGRSDLAVDLATKYRNKAIAIKSASNDTDAIALYDKAISIYESQVNNEGRRDLANTLAITYISKANAISGEFRLEVRRWLN